MFANWDILLEQNLIKVGNLYNHLKKKTKSVFISFSCSVKIDGCAYEFYNLVQHWGQVGGKKDSANQYKEWASVQDFHCKTVKVRQAIDIFLFIKFFF